MEAAHAVANASATQEPAPTSLLSLNKTSENDDSRKPAAKDKSSDDDARLRLHSSRNDKKRPAAVTFDVVDLTTEHQDVDVIDLTAEHQDVCTGFALRFDREASLWSSTGTTTYASLSGRENNTSNKRRKLATTISPLSVYDESYDAVTMNPLLQNDDDDYSLALSLQAAEKQAVEEHVATAQERLQQEGQSMYGSASGQAWILVEKIMALHQQHFSGDAPVESEATAGAGAMRDTTATTTPSDIGMDKTLPFPLDSQKKPLLSVIAVDDMVYTAERFLTALHAFHSSAQASASNTSDLLPSPDVQWDLGYHYTTSENLARIRTDGLLSKTERTLHDIQEAKFNGSVYGDGIYAASNPHGFRNQKFGNVGVLVVRLHGGRQQVWQRRRVQRRNQQGHPPFPRTATGRDSTSTASGSALAKTVTDEDMDDENAVTFDSTIVGLGSYHEFVVLRTAGQCLPICTFSGNDLTDNNNVDQLKAYTQALQSMLQSFWYDILEGTHLPARLPTSANGWAAASRSTQNANSRPTAGSVFPNHLPHTPLLSTSTWSPIPGSLVAAASSTFGTPGCNHALGQQKQQDQPGPVALPNLSYSFAQQQQQLATQVKHQFATQPASISIPLNQMASSTSAPTMQTLSGTGRCNRKPPPPSVVTYTAPTCTSLAEVDLEEAATILRHGTYSAISQECAICLEPLMRNENGVVMQLKRCGHLFHRNCLRSSMRSLWSAGSLCPTCRLNLAAPRGAMPSGTMAVTEVASKDCAGYAGEGSFVLRYNFAAGQLQEAYHPSPGRVIAPSSRTAYVPCTTEGRRLLRRLKFAFARGLTFTIGTSRTTGRPDQITWGEIPHKSKNAQGGPYGFPDASYIDSCNTVLDRLGVPESDLCS